MKEFINKVEEFHNAFGIKNADSLTTADKDTQSLRLDLILEETQEYKEACEQHDIIGIADALGDQLYIIFGTILKHGLQDKIEEIFNEIHRSNMSKLGEDGKPLYREDGKVLKGPKYTKPDIKSIIDGDKYGYNKYRLDKLTLPNKQITYANIEELGFFTNHFEGWTLFHPISEYISESSEKGVSDWCRDKKVFTFHDFAEYIDYRITHLIKMRDERGF
jgi:predicted HAD superfamily Cof-like phosphohydrolase